MLTGPSSTVSLPPLTQTLHYFRIFIAGGISHGTLLLHNHHHTPSFLVIWKDLGERDKHAFHDPQTISISPFGAYGSRSSAAAFSNAAHLTGPGMWRITAAHTFFRTNVLIVNCVALGVYPETRMEVFTL